MGPVLRQGGRPQRTIRQRVFSDIAHGGKLKSKTAAKVWRDEQEVSLNVEPYDRRNGPRKCYGDKTQNIGTALTVTRRGVSISAGFIAGYMKGNTQKNKSYAIRKYGYSTAFLLATWTRLNAIGQPLPNQLIIPRPSKEHASMLLEFGVPYPRKARTITMFDSDWQDIARIAKVRV